MRWEKLPMNIARTLALVLSITAVGIAAPGDGKGDVVAAEQAYTSLDYAQAKTLAERSLTTRGMSHDALLRATRIAALSNAALDKTESARDMFIKLLTYDPDFKLDSKLGPRFQDPFAEARGFWKAQSQRPGIELTTTLRVGSLGAIRVLTRDPTNVANKVLVGYRWAPSRDFVLTTLTGEQGQVDVMAGPKTSSRLDYYAQALDAQENVVFEEGSAASPRTAIAAAEAAGGS
jgi:hypothetical protein